MNGSIVNPSAEGGNPLFISHRVLRPVASNSAALFIAPDRYNVDTALYTGEYTIQFECSFIRWCDFWWNRFLIQLCAGTSIR